LLVAIHTHFVIFYNKAIVAADEYVRRGFCITRKYKHLNCVNKISYKLTLPSTDRIRIPPYFYGWGATSKMEIGVFEAGGSISAKCSFRMGRPPPTIFYIDR